MEAITLPGFIKNLFAGGGSAFIGSVSSLVEKIEAPADQKRQLTLDLQRLQADTDKEEKEEALKVITSYLADVQSSRSMQIEALKQSDLFSKRFVYLLAAIIVALTFIYDFVMLHYSVPTENKDLCNIVAGALNTSCLASVVGFFFGSSAGSQSKDNLLKLSTN